MSKDTGVKEPRSNTKAMKLIVVGENQVKIEVTVEAETFQKGFDQLCGLANECAVNAYRYDQVAKIANVRPVPVTEEVAVTKHDEYPTVGITANGELDPAQGWFFPPGVCEPKS